MNCKLFASLLQKSSQMSSCKDHHPQCLDPKIVVTHDHPQSSCKDHHCPWSSPMSSCKDHQCPWNFSLNEIRKDLEIPDWVFLHSWRACVSLGKLTGKKGRLQWVPNTECLLGSLWVLKTESVLGRLWLRKHSFLRRL